MTVRRTGGYLRPGEVSERPCPPGMGGGLGDHEL